MKRRGDRRAAHPRGSSHRGRGCENGHGGPSRVAIRVLKISSLDSRTWRCNCDAPVRDAKRTWFASVLQNTVLKGLAGARALNTVRVITEEKATSSGEQASHQQSTAANQSFTFVTTRSPYAHTAGPACGFQCARLVLYNRP